jgi:hypothetical protein
VEFSVETFIRNRWAEAKEELARRDPVFIQIVDAHVPGVWKPSAKSMMPTAGSVGVFP